MDKNVCFRLKEELGKLKLSQLQVSAFLDVSSKTVSRWLKGTPIPSDKLALLREKGVNVMYVLTGEHQEQKQDHRIEWIKFEHDGKDCTVGYMRSAGRFLLPARLSGETELDAQMCAAYDATPTALYCGHLFVPSDWLMEEFPDSQETCEQLVRKAEQVRSMDGRQTDKHPHVDVQQFEVIGRALDHMLTESNRKLSTQGLVMVAALVYNYLQEEAETDADQETTLHRALKLVVNNG